MSTILTIATLARRHYRRSTPAREVGHYVAHRVRRTPIAERMARLTAAATTAGAVTPVQIVPQPSRGITTVTLTMGANLDVRVIPTATYADGSRRLAVVDANASLAAIRSQRCDTTVLTLPGAEVPVSVAVPTAGGVANVPLAGVPVLTPAPAPAPVPPVPAPPVQPTGVIASPVQIAR